MAGNPTTRTAGLTLTLLRPAPAALASGLTRARSRRLVLRRLSQLDPVLCTTTIALTGFGSVLVWAATRARSGAGADTLIQRHVGFALLGLVLGLVVATVDHRRLRMLAPAAYLASGAGLLLVLTPLGVTVNGSHSWIHLGGLSVQPLEFAKPAVVLGLAVLLAERRQGRGELAADPRGRNSEVLLALAVTAVPVALVLYQRDLGSVMVLLAAVAGMLVVAAVPLRWLVGLATAAAVGAVVVVQAHLLSQYQLDRLAALANPGMDPSGIGYNAAQARIAIASGGLTGAGLFHGSQTVGQFVPEQRTDFIFTVAGEQFGLVGSAAVVLVFAVLLWRGCRVARNAADLFGALVATGVVCWLGFQAFENMGMATGIMPVAGLPLPFVSYGGSAMVANLVAMGLLLNVDAQRRGRVGPPA
ncbi:MAG TPA: FtsW/RodA/SpoVE family cell cycle protein [Sporichthyaceae bacterium]|jgi:rod shape determining protein RodA|nr:FtsW/RodA/SpoVE family cell cycle protein [Sporichthyaceae bacterium]